MQKIRCVDIELAIMRRFEYVRNIIVPNVNSLLMFEADMLILTPSGYATGFEIKVSLSDLKADFKKKQHINMNDIFYQSMTRKEWFFKKFKYFNYAVPESLQNAALELIPDFCGLWVMSEDKGFSMVKEPKVLFDYKWSDREMLKLAWHGTMRLYKLKSRIRDLENK